MKALVAIDRIRAPRVKNAERCRRFLHDSNGHPGRVLSITHGKVSSGEMVIFAGYSDSAVRQWDILTMTPMCVYMNFSSASLATITADDRRLFTSYSDGTIKLWPIHQEHGYKPNAKRTTVFTQRNFTTMLGHSDHVIGLKIMKNLLVSASLDQTVRVWDLHSCLLFGYATYESEQHELSHDQLLADEDDHDDGGGRANPHPRSTSPSSPATTSAYTFNSASKSSSLRGGPHSLGFESPYSIRLQLLPATSVPYGP